MYRSRDIVYILVKAVVILTRDENKVSGKYTLFSPWVRICQSHEYVIVIRGEDRYRLPLSLFSPWKWLRKVVLGISYFSSGTGSE